MKLPLAIALLLAACAEPARPDFATLEDDDGDGWPRGLDCDDKDDSRYPGAAELCDGQDHDCDGIIGDNARDATPAWIDLDRDGYGDPSKPAATCGSATTEPRAPNHLDCDDTDRRVSPTQRESCFTPIDDNCDGLLDATDALGCTVWYADADGDGVGAEASRCLCEPEQAYTALTTGDCDDDDPARAGDCGAGGPHTLDADATVLVGGRPGDLAGAVVAGIGDLDGDGWPDVLVGGRLPRPEIVRGPLVGPRDLTTAPFVLDLTGASGGVPPLASLDADGDGADDLFVSACSGGREEELGATTTILRASPTPDTVWRPTPDAVVARFTGCASVSPLTALGDGRLAVGLVGTQDVAIFGVSDPSAVVHLHGDPGFGMTVRSAGDTDGDGLDDLLAGGETAHNRGVVWLFTGAIDATTDTTGATATLSGTVPNGRFATALAHPGDVDGDGYDDVLAGAFTGDAGPAEAWLFRGPLVGDVTPAAAVGSIRAAVPGPIRLAGPGDIDGDGLADLLVGMPYESPYRILDSGRAGVVLGPASGTIDLEDADRTWFVGEANEQLGTSVSGLGDVTGDGLPDLALGVPGLGLGGPQAGGVWIVPGAQ